MMRLVVSLILLPGIEGQQFKKMEASRHAELISEYFSHPTRDGPEGVEAAVSFLVDQEKSRSIKNIVKSRTQKKVLDDGRCIVSHDRIVQDGYFVREHQGKAPPYNWSCPVMRSRYHLAPGCAFTAAPVHEWRWTLPEAEEMKCQMPDPAPAQVAKSFLTKYKKGRKRMHILMLGLSFMGQPYQSLGCLNQDTLVDGFFMTARRQKDSSPGLNISLAEITQQNGQCTGLDRNLINSYFPHQHNIPHQNVYHCSTDHSALLFRNKDDDFEALVCFQYMFNPHKNIKQNAKLPCGLQWNSLDAVISLFPNKIIKDVYMPRLQAPITSNSFSTIFISINDIYQAAIEPQLRLAYKKHGFAQPTHKDLQAAPKDCSHRDVHYALPGFTDHAVKIWFSLLASGLDNDHSPLNINNKKSGPTFIGRWNT